MQTLTVILYVCRDEIAGCSEKGYDYLSISDAKQMFMFSSDQELQQYIAEVDCIPFHFPCPHASYVIFTTDSEYYVLPTGTPRVGCQERLGLLPKGEGVSAL